MKATTVTFAALAAVSSVMATPLLNKRCSPVDVFPTYEDTNSRISYSSGWTFIENQGTRDAGGVEAYSGEASASYSTIAPLGGGSFTINCGKKFDRGYFDVYINDDHVGRGDAHGSCKSNCDSTVVFTGDLTGEAAGVKITVRNRDYDSRLSRKTPYLDLNTISFIPSNC